MEAKKILEQARDLIYPTGSHIYFLINCGKIVYVGKSNSLLSRIATHQKEKIFDSVKHIAIPEEDQSTLELALIKSLRPEYNTQPLSKMNVKEKLMLEKYKFDDEVTKAMVRTQPKVEQCQYGYVAFFQDDELVFGLYDDDSTREELHEHDVDCMYLNCMTTLEIEPDDDEDLDLLLCEYCTCLEFAVVLIDFHRHYRVELDKLYSAEDGYFKKFREGFSTKYLSQVEELRKEGETDRERRKEA